MTPIADDPGRNPTPLSRLDRAHVLNMSNDKERGEKRGVLETGRARKLQDADADAADNED